MDERTTRLVLPRRMVLAGGAAMAGALMVHPARAQVAEGGAGGDGGAGGEGGAAAGAGGNVPLLTALGLVEGHLLSGSALYRAGVSDMALVHKQHPSKEIYADLAPMLDAVGAPGFAPELEAAANAVMGGQDAGTVAAAEAAALAAIDRAREAAGATPAEIAQSVEALVRTAADEYVIGIVDGQVAELAEYQDAWGFMQVAKAQTEALATVAPEVAARMAEALAPTDALFPAIVPEGRIAADPRELQGAAARIELARLQLD